MITLSTDDYLWFVDQALDEMARIVTELGDDDANRRPDLPDANSPFAILTHCLGVLEFWPAYMVVGRPFERDRDAEFRATGSVADLVERTHAARRQLADDLAGADLSAAPDTTPCSRTTWARPSPRRRAGSWSTCCVRSHSTSARWRSLGTCCSRRATTRATERGRCSAPGCVSR